ncbi:MAG TPA: non-canonical purine NTP pyrophosphatase [Parachlamydiaceae bacterium]|nr:non-canonical purine NTP pyrophosphatase [Parachlamydiaceae bacterium]
MTSFFNTCLITLAVIFLIYLAKNHLKEEPTPMPHPNISKWHLNTSNAGKLKEFQNLFNKYNIELFSTQFDLDEIDSDPASVVAHKASQLDELILIEDTSLDIEGASIGINVRWLIEHLNEHIGRKALWTVLLAYRQADEVLIYKGEVKGTITHARGDQGFGFDPVFLPENSNQTLAEAKPDEANARALAVEALVKGNMFKKVKAIYNWDGPWQEN